MNKFLMTPLVFLAFATTLTSAASGQSFEEQGLDFGGSYTAGYQAAPIGSDGGDSAKQRLTLHATADLEKIFGLKDGTVFFQYQNHNGDHGVNNIHDIQQFDGLDDPEYNRIHMLWYQQLFMDGKLRVKVGKVEPKSEFFAPINASNHLGFSTERSPTIIAQGPPSMSFNAFYSPTENFELAFGVYDATWNQGRDENNFKLHNFFAAANFAIFAEGRYKWKSGFTGLPGSFKVGFWRLDGEKMKFNGQQVDGTSGYYMVFDQTLTESGIGMYAQYGYADEEISPLSNHFGIGMQWVGPFEVREKDTIGIGVSSVKFSDAVGSPFLKGSEIAYEIFYKAPITDFLTVQADLQAIINPGGITAENVVVATFRATISF